MFTQEDLDTVLKQNKINQTVAEKLLNLYVGPADWRASISTLYRRLVRKHGEEEGKNLTKKAISFTILLPAFDGSTKIDQNNPENLLFWGMSYHQFNQRDWFEELKKVVERDQQITDWRREALALGVIDPIDYQPYTRQAYKWLCGKAEETGVELTQDLKLKFRQLVMTYGGAVISYIFTNHQDAVKKVVNWRSGYFFERIIFDVYSIEKVLKIKQTELQKTNDKFIKQVTVSR